MKSMFGHIAWRVCGRGDDSGYHVGHTLTMAPHPCGIFDQMPLVFPYTCTSHKGLKSLTILQLIQ